MVEKADNTKKNYSSFSNANQSFSKDLPPRVPGGAPRGIVGRVPRKIWLLSAAIMLAISSAWAWWRMSQEAAPYHERYELFSRAWWTEPLEINAAGTLPDFTGHLYAVAIVPGSQRVWVGGERGLLAYSDDDGGCWTKLDYQAGEFRIPPNNPCARKQQTVLLRLPDLFPNVQAAALDGASNRPEDKQAKKAPAETNAYGLDTRQQNPSQTAAVREVTKADFSTNSLKFDPIAVGTASKPQNLTVANPGKQRIDVGALRTRGDSRNFSIKNGCGPSLAPGQRCTIVVQFLPMSAASHRAVLVSPTSYSDLVEMIGTGLAPASQQSAPERELTWTPPPTPPDLVAISFPSETDGQIASRSDVLFTTANGGDQWGAHQRPDVPGEIYSASGKGVEFVKNSGGRAPNDPYFGGYFISSDRRFAFRSKAMSGPGLETSNDGGKTWKTVETSPANFRAEALWFVDQLRGWAVPSDGMGKSADSIFRTRDGGRNWQGQSVVSGPRLRSIVFRPGGSRGWAAGDDGVLLQSVDSGARWGPSSRQALPAAERSETGTPWRLLPPLSLAGLLLTLLLAGFAAAAKPMPDDQYIRVKQDVADVLVSDRPLEPGEPDALELGTIASGLSRFLRNENTPPPLTIAINGEWGTGKSSLMNLLRRDLESYGMQPVWFNAWHHQKEEHLLAALLQSIRLEAVPKIWHLRGLKFRMRLLAARISRYAFWLALAALVATLLFSLDRNLEKSHKPDISTWMLQHGRDWIQSLEGTAPAANTTGQQPETPAQAHSHPFGWLIGILTTLGALWKGITAFGASPANLLASVSRGNKIKDLDAQTSFRQKFIVEFGEFTNALNPERPLVIFIDDLDRCLPDNVREVLEAVNFLVTSGDCFIVLGMARGPVEAAVGLSFKDVAAEMAHPPAGPGSKPAFESAADDSRGGRKDFARHYLDKLINIEVPVPKATPHQAEKLFVPDSPAPQQPVELYVGRAVAVLRFAVPLAFFMLLAWGAFLLGPVIGPGLANYMGQNDEKSPGILSQPPAESVQLPERVASPGTGKAPPPAQNTGVTKQAGTSRPEPKIVLGTPVKPALWLLGLPFYLLALFLVGATWVLITSRPGLIVQDSPEFTTALKIWYPLVLATPVKPQGERQATPRAAKRFVNRVRYLAMRQRSLDSNGSLWQRVLYPDRLGTASANGAGVVDNDGRPGEIPESLLVALAAIENLEPAWIRNDPDLAGLKDTAGPSTETNAGAKKLYLTSRDDHAKSFANWSQVAQHRERFLEIWPEVTVR